MASKKRIRFIINPFSGVSKKNNIPQLIQDNLDLEKFDYEIKFTEYPMHAKFIAEDAKNDGFDFVGAVGGDGTVNEIASSLVNSSTTLAVLPAGSGNGFAMHLGMGRNIAKAIKMLNDARSIAIDSCTANEHFYINIAGVGFDSMVANISKKDSSRGIWLYIKHTLLRAFTYSQKYLTIQLDQQKREGYFLSVSIANGSMFGYNFRIAPKALLTDGLLDLVMIKKVPLWRYLISFWRFFNRTAEKLNFVEVIKCKRVVITSQDQIYHHIDGEGVGQLIDLEIQIKPKSLHVLVPSHKLD